MTRGVWPVCAIMLLASGCRDALPAVAPPVTLREDHGFAVVPRPSCTTAVLDAVAASDPDALRRAIAAGANVRCGDAPAGRTPLDRAVEAGSVDDVRVLLEAGADPNMRWGDWGDHLPLQEAIDGVSPRGDLPHRDQIVRLLLEHGADPNARWCPFQSRVARDAAVSWEQWGCVSDTAVTPLIEAAAADQADTVYRLLDAGASLGAADWTGRTAIDYAHSAIVRDLLVSASRYSTRASFRRASAS